MPNNPNMHSVYQGETGFSLVELMVSITIGLLLLLGLVTLLVNSSATHTELQKSSAQIENGRYAMQLLSEDISIAGYYAEYSPTGYTTPEKPCVGAVTPTAPNMPSPIGYDISSVTADFACLTNRQAGTGVLVLRRAQTLPATAVVTGATYLQVSQCNTDSTTTPFMFLVANATPAAQFTLRTIYCDATKTPPSPLPPQLVAPPPLVAPAAALRKFVVHIYYISSCNVCAPTSDGIPTLKMVEYADGAAQSPTALVEGIEDMQFDYGVDSTGDGSPDDYYAETHFSPAGTPADCANEMSVRVNLLARNIQTTAGYDDSKTYAIGLAKPTYTVPSGVARTYKRHLYSALIRVENPSSRREAP
jgi:type IV pilus assembly protein PilW